MCIALATLARKTDKEGTGYNYQEAVFIRGGGAGQALSEDSKKNFSANST